MSAKRRFAKFVARIIRNLPELSDDDMQNLMENPVPLRNALVKAFKKCVPQRVLPRKVFIGENPFTPINRLNMSMRVTNALRTAVWAHKDAIKSVEQLVGCSAGELLVRRNFGKVSLNEVRKCLASYGLHLRGE